MRFIDTNIFVRALAQDDPVKGRACAALLLEIRDGAEEAMTTESVIAEVFYVLSGRTYRTPRADVAVRLRPIVAIRDLRLDSRQIILDALDVIEAYPSLDFEDALIVARMRSEQIDELYSYDRDFDRVPGITRLEPASA